MNDTWPILLKNAFFNFFQQKKNNSWFEIGTNQ